MKSPTISGSIGSQIMAAQQQNKHRKRISQINQKKGELSEMTVNQKYLMMSANRSSYKISKKVFNDQMSHHLRIKHLIQRLNSPKSFNQRKKDQNDFLANPTLFFRKSQNDNKKKHKVKSKDRISSKHFKLNYYPTNDIIHHDNHKKNAKVSKTQKLKTNKLKVKQQQSQNKSINSDMVHNGLSFQKVARQLPKYINFDQQDIESFADHLTRIIFDYNLDSMQDIQFLFECVEKYIPESYPQHFVEAIQNVFKQIITSLNIQENE